MGRFSTGGQGGGQLHTPRTPRQPPARKIPQRRNKSEAAPTYPTRGNVGTCLKIERKQQKNKEKKIVGFFIAPLTLKLLGKLRDGELAGKLGVKSIPLPWTLCLSAHYNREGLKKLFYLSAKIPLYNLKGLRLEASFTCSILPELKNPATIQKTAGLGGGGK